MPGSLLPALPALPALLACPSPLLNPAVQIDAITNSYVHGDWQNVVVDSTRGPVSLPVRVGLLHQPHATIAGDAGMGLETRAGK